MIDDNSDVFVSLFVDCLVYTDMDKIIKSMGYFRFDHIFSTADASAYCFPIHTEIFRNDAAGKMHSKPSYSQVKVLCKTTSGICPRNIGNNYSVFGTLDTVCLIFDLNQRCAPVKTSPYPRFLAARIIA